MKIYSLLTKAAMASAMLLAVSCSNDMELLYTDGSDDIALSGDTGDIVLSADALDALALTLYWNDNGLLTTSDPKIQAPVNKTQNSIELSANADFEPRHEISVDAGVYEYQFVCRDLNGILSKLGFKPGVMAPLYVRVRGVLADNLTPKYSDVRCLNATPYHIDTTVGFYLNSSKEDTGRTLYSPADNHVYSGFIGAGAWENWWLKEGDGTTWGNDDVTGTPFVISSKGSAWNFWYPGISGCYYTIVDTPASEWSALLIESLTVSGDIEGEMTYERKLNQWTLHVAGNVGSKNITIKGSAKQYDVATGTDDGAAVAKTVSFGGNADALDFKQTADAGAITVTTDGECDLILDLSDPKAWTLKAGTAAAPEEKPAKRLWVVGHNDGITGGWNFDSWLTLYNEDNKCYGGVLDVNSLWGFKFYKEVDNWSDCWGMVEGGNGYEGQLSADGGNISAPDSGLYVADVTLSGLTYRLFKINTVHYTGLNDDWSLSPMTATEKPGVYEATVTKSADTPWGVKILINESWDLFFGGGDGQLLLYHDGFDGDNQLSNGTYKLTVNLCEGTYSYE